MVNLVKSFLGAGILTLPSGLATVSGHTGAAGPATVLIAIFATLSAYCFILIGRICEATGASTYEEAWARTISRQTSWLPWLAVVAKTHLSCVSYLMILGDCLHAILEHAGLPAAITARNGVILWITLLVLLPLCNLRSLAPLAKFSFLGIISSAVSVLVILFRFFDQSYVRGGHFFHRAVVHPRFDTHSGNVFWEVMSPTRNLALISMMAYAFTYHYNAPLFYSQLAPGADGSRRIKMRNISASAFAVAAGIFALVMTFGFWTFGFNSPGMILNAYAKTDPLATIARLGLVMSITSSFPLVFAGFRAGITGALGTRIQKIGARWPLAQTLALLVIVALPALCLHDLGRLAGVGGSLLGSFVIYIAPALMSLALRIRRAKSGSPNGSASREVGGNFECLLHVILLIWGVKLAILGTKMSLH